MLNTCKTWLVLSAFVAIMVPLPVAFAESTNVRADPQPQSLFETARQNGDVLEMLKAAQLQEDQESSGSTVSAGPSAAEMISIALSSASDRFDYSELMQMFDTYSWELLPGRPVVRRRPMPVNQRTAFEFLIMDSSSFALRVQSRKQRARYRVSVHSSNGQLLCGSANATFDFSCRFDATVRDIVRVSIESVGPFDSHLEVLIN